MPNYDFVCTKCGEASVEFLPMSECTTPQLCVECGGTTQRAYLKAPEVNDSTSAIHIVKPPEYTHMIREAKASQAWKGTKDKKKREELKKAARELSKHKT